MLEYRCCREIANAQAKMTFDESIEPISCITQHEDYTALSNRAVLLQVGPLLRGKDGRSYRRRNVVSENEVSDLSRLHDNNTYCFVEKVSMMQ